MSISLTVGTYEVTRGLRRAVYIFIYFVFVYITNKIESSLFMGHTSLSRPKASVSVEAFIISWLESFEIRSFDTLTQIPRSIFCNVSMTFWSSRVLSATCRKHSSVRCDVSRLSDGNSVPARNKRLSVCNNHIFIA